MSPQSIHERIRESVYQSRRKRWYQRVGGRTVLVLLFLFLVGCTVFAVKVVQVYQDVSSGKVSSSEFIDSLQQQAKVDLLSNGDDPSTGSADAPVIIVAFEDFQCPFCFQAQPFINKLRVQYPKDVRFIYKDFPLNSIHAKAQGAAEAAQCAFEQDKFWQFHDELFAHQDRLADAYYRAVAKDIGLNINQFNECYSSGKYKKQVALDVELGRSLGVIGTPTFFVNGELFAQGYGPELDQMFIKAIEYIKGL